MEYRTSRVITVDRTRQSGSIAEYESMEKRTYSQWHPSCSLHPASKVSHLNHHLLRMWDHMTLVVHDMDLTLFLARLSTNRTTSTRAGPRQ